MYVCVCLRVRVRVRVRERVSEREKEREYNNKNINNNYVIKIGKFSTDCGGGGSSRCGNQTKGGRKRAGANPDTGNQRQAFAFTIYQERREAHSRYIHEMVHRASYRWTAKKPKPYTLNP